ncbi:MAG: DUF4041 domain-containing protein [Acidobacteria bacterium]|nr:DUF4041 domain-containing protein [Acidobacteriota bacterium]
MDEESSLLIVCLGIVLVIVVARLVMTIRRLAVAEQREASALKQLADQAAAYKAEELNWKGQIASLERDVAQLAKWQSVIDADVRAADILKAAEASASRARAEAETFQARAKSEVETLTETARQEAKGIRETARNLLDNATVQAATIVDAARKQAEEIAGQAYQAMKNAGLFQETVTAMKNIIEGYGDRYLVPERSLLDDLAEEFSYADAGLELKRARERTKSMIRNQTAATCDYVEEQRRTTAINFVVDAFNGKVDSILSRLRSDNVGTLEREIRDAFSIVNFHGKAFRSARIQEAFLASRLAELRWGSAAQQLKDAEREEQRRIKEQIREEDRARREYERAIREAAKDEELLRKAVEKVRLQVEQANEAERSKFEAQLRDLGERLKVAEERGQRAMSMAQQTRRGHVYIISNVGSFGENVYKIGLTRRLEPLDRIRELGDSSVPFEFDVHALIFSEDAPSLERQLHKHFVMTQVNKVNYRKEFFRLDIKSIRHEVEQLGLETAKWTMTALAREYRETLAIEKTLEENPSLREAWANRQLNLEATFEAAEDEHAAVTE